MGPAGRQIMAVDENFAVAPAAGTNLTGPTNTSG